MTCAFCCCCRHTIRLQINDLAFEAVQDPATGKVMFNVLVGGYFSLKRNIMSVPLGVSITEDQLIPFTLATLRVFRWVHIKVCSLMVWLAVQ